MEVGDKVTRVKVGENVGVGCVRDSCLLCEVCDRGEECYCKRGFTHTYNTPKNKVGFFCNLRQSGFHDRFCVTETDKT